MPKRLGLNPREDMVVCKCIVTLRHGGTLNSHRAASHLVWLVEGEERWEAPDHPQGFIPLNWGGTEQKRTITCMVLKAANDRRKFYPLAEMNFTGFDLTSSRTYCNGSKARNKYFRNLRPHAIKEKGRRRLSYMAEQNRSQTVGQLTAQYNAGPSRIVSEHTVQRTLLDTGLSSKRRTRVPLLAKRQRQLCMRLAREHYDWSMD
ncbi:transposase domain containing protein [Trichonephila clavipes]|nr:transposase domain containing protein [Trichonephila clavipes]